MRLLPFKLVLLVGEVAIKVAMSALLTVIMILVMMRGCLLVVLHDWSLLSRFSLVLEVLSLQSILSSLFPCLVGTLLLLIVHLFVILRVFVTIAAFRRGVLSNDRVMGCVMWLNINLNHVRVMGMCGLLNMDCLNMNCRFFSVVMHRFVV